MYDIGLTHVALTATNLDASIVLKLLDELGVEHPEDGHG